MKKKLKELDVDFIGGGSHATDEDFKKVSEFIKLQKEKNQKATTKKKKPSKGDK